MSFKSKIYLYLYINVVSIDYNNVKNNKIDICNK